MKFIQFFSAIVVLAFASNAVAQCDPLSVDFGAETWGLSPDGEETFFDPAYVDVPYTDEVHLLVPSFASDVEPETPLDAPIDSVVIVAVLLVDTLNGDTATFAELGLEYNCNNLGDCTDPCTFLGGGQYCAAFTGVPNQTGDYVLSMEVTVWATVFGFPLATPFSFDGFPFPILGTVGQLTGSSPASALVYPNPSSQSTTVSNARGVQASLWSMDGRQIRNWTVGSDQETLEVSDLAEGLYFLRLLGEGKDEVVRLVVQR